MKRNVYGGGLVLAALAAVASMNCPAQTTHEPPAEDVVTTAMFESHLSYDKEASTWHGGEREVFTTVLSAGHFDWLVVPAQTQRRGFDRAQRSMITAELARAILEHHLSVPDPYLIERALGEGARRFSLDEVGALARQLDIKVIVVPYVGYDESGGLCATLAVYRRANDSRMLIEVRPLFLTAKHPRVTDVTAPLDSFIDVMPDLLARLELPAQQVAVTTGPASRVSTSPTLPRSPELLASVTGDDPLDDAMRFAVLAELSPGGMRASERLFERSLLAARRASASNAQKFLEAHALFHLNLRPAAARILRQAATPALASLQAIVNGNLTGTASMVQRTYGYERLILEFELHRLMGAYGHATERVPLPQSLRVLADRSGGWSTLLARQWNFGAEGVRADNLDLKKILDEIYPIAGESLQEIVRVRSSVPGLSFDEVDLELTPREHIRHLVMRNGGVWCCSAAFQRPGSWDYLALLDAWSDVNLAHAVEMELDFRGLPHEAGRILDRLDRVLSGHPIFESLHAETDIAISNTLPATQRAALRQSARAHALKAFLSSGGEPSVAVPALEQLAQDSPIDKLARAFASDYPVHAAWLGVDLRMEPTRLCELLLTALANTQTGVGFAERLMIYNPAGARSELRSALLGRFAGHPDLERVLKQIDASGSRTDNLDAATAIATLQRKVKAEPDVWDTRVQLASWLSANQRYSEAAKILAAFPGFLDQRPGHPVALSNMAADAGHRFYWQGAQSEAREMYRIATRFPVGSDAQMTAALHLKLLNDDLPGALAEAARRADRYPTDTSYRYYLSLLDLLGYSEQSWKAFDALRNQPLGPGLWEAAMVGLRIAGTTEANFQRWISRPEINSAGSPGDSWAAVLNLMWATTDRKVDPQIVERITSLNHEPKGLIEGTERVASYPNRSGNRFLVYRSEFRADQRHQLDYGAPVPTDMVLFARALVPLHTGDFATAVGRFDDLAARFPIEHEVEGADAVYALPEFAYASARSGDPLHLEKFLNGLTPDQQMFELALAHTYFRALAHHDIVNSLADLEQVFVLIEHVSGRTPSMEYQYADAAERLFRETGDVRFRERALTWCRSMQRLEPWAAWAYTIEVELSEDPAQRRAALVKAMFLDSQSPRLKSVSDADVVWARGELAHGNPFLHSASRKL